MRRITLPTRLSAATIATLEREITDADAEAVVLVGEGPFCLGLDLERARSTDDLEAFARVLAHLRTHPRPCVALVDGACLGGGLGLAIACDVVLATDRARFGLPEGLFGLVPAIVLPLLAERVPAQRLRLLAMRGVTIGPVEAVALGLADRVVDVTEAESALKSELRLLARCAPVSIAWLKRAPGLRRALERRAGELAERLGDPAVARAVADFEAGVAPWDER